MDDSTRLLELPASARAAVSPAIAALRWGAFGYGLLFAAPAAFDGSYEAVVATAVCLFLTTWRTVLPLRLGAREPARAAVPFLDVAVLGFAVGYGGGLGSPYFFCVLAAVVVLAFGWGAGRGAAGLVLALAALAAGTALGPTTLSEQWDTQRDLAAVMVLVIGTAAAAFARHRLVDSESRRADLVGRIDRLAETNELLMLLNRAARTLPTSLTLREALERSRRQLIDTFDARVICLLTYDEPAEDWVPKLAEGCVLRPSYPTGDLPSALAAALASDRPVLAADLNAAGFDAVSRSSGSGVYLRLDARDHTIGLLAVEHPDVGHFDGGSVELLDGLADVLALTVDNARWFGRLRSLGAEEERVRIARDLHDRLGQWLTYISLELERIMTTEPARAESLNHLHGDVQAALDELRETLRQLRSGVSDDRPLAALGPDVVHRFAERNDLAATFTAVHPDERLPVPVENEVLRILQEALNNVDKHAKADHVDVVWDVRGGNFELVVSDDGRGFDSARGVRDSAYGLVGMRERADVIGARLTIESRPGEGTTVRVTAGSDRTEEVTT
jgi:signal transduction histidine kinase